jgi:hypothetical protein
MSRFALFEQFEGISISPQSMEEGGRRGNSLVFFVDLSSDSAF